MSQTPTTNLDDNLPMLGENVIWYAGADKNSDAFVCTVTGINGQGGLTMAVIPPRGGTLYGPAAYRDNIFHVDSPEVTLRPEFAREKGGWDTLKNHEERRRSKILKNRQQTQARVQAEMKSAVPVDPEAKLREQVLRLHAAGKTPESIASITSTKKAVIEEIIKKSLSGAGV